jgi:CRISPR/Cas system CSM-associated protein Csm4 (group 5 of RAMP superfamily)
MNGYSILPLPISYLYGLISMISINNFPLRKSKTKTKSKTKSKTKTKTDDIVIEKVYDKYNIRVNQKTNKVNKNDINLLTHIMYKLERQDENFEKTLAKSNMFIKHKTI